MFNGLVKWDAANSVPVPDLATLWEFDSNGDLIFKIRPGVKYHNEAPVNGRAMTAEDIKWSMDRMRNPDDPKAVYRNRFVNVEDIQVVDPSTIKFVMKGPDANLLLNLAHEWFVVLAREAAVDGGYDEPKSYIGTGPFTPELIQLTALSQFEKNPTYFREGRPYVDAITYIDGGDEATRSSLLKTGNLDWSYVQSPDNVEFFQGRTDARIEGTLGALRGFWGWGFNVTLAPFDDVRVRRAIHLGMNRQEEIALVYGGNAYLAGPLGANAPWHWSQEKLLSLPGMRPDKDADIAEAKRLLSQAGYDGGLEVTVFSRGAPGKDIQLFVEQLKAIGVTVKLETSTERIINTDRSVDVPSQWLSAGGGVTPDFALFQSYHSTAPRNFAHYTNPELEAMIDEQATTLDENKRIQQLDQIQQLLWDAMPYAPGTRPLGFWVAWDYVKNWTAPDHFCCEYRAAQIADVWLDQ